MKKISLIAFSAFNLFTVTSQTLHNQAPVHTGGKLLTERKGESQKATGSMYLNNDYLSAKISGEDTSLLINYNAYNDYFEIYDPHLKTVRTLAKDPNINITFSNTNDSYIYTNYTNEKKEALTGYLKLISNNAKVTIYKKESIYLQPEKHPANSYDQYKAPMYKRAKDEFFIKINDNIAQPLPTNRNKAAKLFNSKEKQVSEFIKKNKLSLTEEKDLDTLGKYLDSIL